MSLLPNLTFTSPGNPLYGAAGGGGSGPNPTFSTITLEGSNAITATLPSAPNDGFEVRNGGGGQNVVVVTTIDENNAAQAEMGIRTLSTIAGNTSNVGRFELQMDGLPTDVARLIYTLDAAVSGTPSTIGSIEFKPATAPATGYVVITGEDTTGLVIGQGNVSMAVGGSALRPLQAAAQSGGNIYVPAAGTTQPVANFSTIAGHAYEMWIPGLRVQNQPAGAPAAGAWCQLTVNTSNISYVDTFDMASVSTIANDFQKAASYSFIASGAAHSLEATGSLANTLSTALTLNPPVVYLRDLGLPGSFATVG